MGDGELNATAEDATSVEPSVDNRISSESDEEDMNLKLEVRSAITVNFRL